MIRYLKLITQYAFKKKTALVLFLTAIVPSMIAGVFLTPFSEVSVFSNPDKFRNMNFMEIYWRASGYGTGNWFLPLLSLVLFTMMVTLLVATVDRHMRIGDLRFRNPLRRLNENIWVVIPVFVAFLLIKEVFDIALSLMIYLCLGLDATLFTPILALCYLIAYFGFSVVIALLVNWVPHSFDTGLSAPKSLASSVKLCGTHHMSIALAIFIGIVIISTMMSFAIMAGELVRILLSALSYYSLSIYFVVMMYVVYYDITGIEREDINVVDIWNKKNYV